MKNYESLFVEKKLVGNNLLEIMKEKGYTKISLSKATGISRPTLDRLFEGEINSITTYEKHIKKVKEILDVDMVQLTTKREHLLSYYEVAYSENQPKDYVSNKNEDEMFSILDSLIDLCEFYY